MTRIASRNDVHRNRTATKRPGPMVWSTFYVYMWMLVLSLTAPVMNGFSLGGGGGGGEYLYKDDPLATPFLTEYTDTAGSAFHIRPGKRVVEFYSPYCGHCQRFKPQYMAIAKDVLARDSSIQFFAVSCAAHSVICQQYKVKAYPTVMVFDDTKFSKGEILGRGTSGVTVASILSKFEESSATAGRKVQKQNFDGGDDDDGKDDDDGNDEMEPNDDDVKEDDDASDEMESEEDSDDNDVNNSVSAATTRNNGQTNNVAASVDDDHVQTLRKQANKPPNSPRTARQEEARKRLRERWAERRAQREDMQQQLRQAQQELPPSASLEERAALVRARIEDARGRANKGAMVAKQEPKDLDRFQPELAEQRQRIASQERFKRLAANRLNRGTNKERITEQASEGATETMKKFVPGTREYELHKAEIVETIKKNKGKRAAEKVERQMTALAQNVVPPGTTNTLPFQKQVTKPKFVEKVPVVKRMVKMSHEEELIIDVTLSFIHSLKIGIFRTTGPLTKPQKNALEDWLALLRVSLPQEWAIHNLIDDLLDNFKIVTKSSNNLERIVNQFHFPRKEWTKSCATRKTVGSGFTCGFWKLLHVASIGLAEYRGGINLMNARMTRADAIIFSPEEAADTLREYIANFFPCTDCAEHFLERYDDCSYRRCTRLSDNFETATDADWKEFGKWLWEFHNEVSVRILNEKADLELKKSKRSSLLNRQAGPGRASVEDEIKVLFPTLHDCVKCFTLDGGWNEDAVFLFLEKTYWPSSKMDKKTARLLKFTDPSLDNDFNLTLILLFVGLLLLYALKESLFSPTGLQQTMIRARTLAHKGISGAPKRSV